MNTISVLIPARDEADRIGETVQGVFVALATLAPLDAEVLVIDDGSQDETAKIALAAGAVHLIRLAPGRGKGGALNEGLAQSRGEIIVTVDADVGATAVEISKLISPVLAGKTEMTLAEFPAAGHSGGFGLVVRLSRWAIRRATGVEVRAPLSGQRAIRRELLDAVGGFAAGYGAETALTLDALRRGYHVLPVATEMRHRALGRSAEGFLHRAKQLLHVARVVLQKRAWRRLPKC